MCNTSRTHVEKRSETCVACTLKQTHETIETWWWNNYSISLDFHVLMNVRPIFLCNLYMVYMFSLYNMLTTLRAHNGTMFMLIILLNCASKWWLTMYGPWNTFVWPFQKYDLGTLYCCAPIEKVEENFIRNKLCLRVKSWKCGEHAQTGPTIWIWGWFQHLAIFSNPDFSVIDIGIPCSQVFIKQLELVQIQKLEIML
jgi:hypothetical protein